MKGHLTLPPGEAAAFRFGAKAEIDCERRHLTEPIGIFGIGDRQEIHGFMSEVGRTIRDGIWLLNQEKTVLEEYAFSFELNSLTN